MTLNLSEDLRTHLRVQITVLNKSLFRPWAGKGVRRQRQLTLTDALLEDFGKRLATPYFIRTSDGAEMKVEELDRLIRDCFLSFTDDLVARAVSKNWDESAAAISVMAETIASEIEGRWTLTEKPVSLGHR